MYKIRNSLVALTGLVVLIGVISFAVPRTGVSQNPKPPQDVRLVASTVNVPVTAGTPLPVAGNINVVNTPMVGIDPLTNAVRVENAAGPLLVHDVSVAQVREPVVHRGANTIPEGQFDLTVPFVDVPPGKRWVIEYVEAR